MQRLDLGTLSEAEAEKLLLVISPRIGEHAPELAKLCGYLPLALRVSATLLQEQDDYPVAEYLADLGKAHLDLLADPDYPDDPSRSVAASLLLSYQRLTQAAQQTFQQTGVFIGSFTREALIAVVEGVEDAARQARDLRRRSLLDYDAASERYDLHDLARTFALTRLPDERPTRLRHARYYVQVANYAEEELYLKGKQSEGLKLFDRERRQIDAGWQWAITQFPADDTDRILLDFADATVYVGDLRYNLRGERIPQLEAQAAAAQRLGRKSAENAALSNLGIAFYDLGLYGQAIDYYNQALMIVNQAENLHARSNIFSNIGLAYAELGEKERAIDYHKRALAIAYEMDDRRGEGIALCNLGNLLDHTDSAIDHYKQALAIAREIGDQRSEVAAVSNLVLQREFPMVS
jgi:tetratricopeptide (TPR) repeat protein